MATLSNSNGLVSTLDRSLRDLDCWRERGDEAQDKGGSDHVRLSIILSAIANSRNATAPRQYPTGSSRNTRCLNASVAPTTNASAARPINSQHNVRMVAGL